MSEKALSIIPTQEERFELLKDHAPEEFLEACEKNGQFRHAAEDLHSRGKFKEAADMFIRSGFKDEDVIEAFQCLLHLCRVNVLKSSMTNTMSPSNAELRDIICTISETLNKLESQLSKAKREEFVAEFRAINIWLKIPQQSDIQFEYWHERLQCLQRLCADLAFPYIDTRRNVNNLIARKEFEEIFVVSEVKDREQKRKCSSDNPLVHLIDEDTAENIDYWHVYDVEVMHHAISQLLVSYIYELLWNVNQRGREIPFIGNYICYKYESCQKSDCRKHHVVPSPTMLYKRLTLAWLQYTVLRQWDLLYHLRLLKDEQSKVVRPAERWWTEQLVNYHIRYQSPQTSCPEVTNMVLANYTWYELINTADKIWLGELSNEPNNFAVMLKCMLVFQQFRNKWSIDKFNWEMSKTIELLYPNELPVGYDYYGYGYAVAIPVGKRLSLFYIWLYSKNEYCVINAIMHINIFIQYAINNAESVYIDTPDAFSDLATLMEFKVSLVFAVAPGYCNFCLPRSYLVNYFDACKTEPLIPDRRRSYDRENYNAAVKDSLEQVQQLLEYLIYDDRFYQYQSIILRLIRLLVLIGRNEPTFATKVFNLFKYLSKDASSINIKIKKYMDESQMGRLVNILKDDLKETGCDSLVIVQYQWGGLSRFAELEKSGGVMVLKYKSNEEFRESLMRIKSRVVIEESTETGVPAYKSVPQRTEQNIAFVEDEDDDRLSISRDASEPTTDTQAWFRQIQDSPRAQEEAKKIQDWFRRAIEKRQKSREHVHDQALEKIYNDVRDFCQAVTYWECAVTQKGEKAVRSYHMLLRGLAVDVIVELTKLRDIMDKIKNKLKKKINDPTDGEKLEIYLEFEDDLKEIHNDVKLRLNSISTTEGEHEEADIEWLKYELQQARNTINQVKEWIDNYKAAI
ncbi:2575_t:CDS:2 [Funneliformis caledonium]|uniref:2575_t:CDS:1 n=1 Tax=Funneliformis caledonium TaxID=1117310 RepID=A0A9N9D2K7_9GLOM|nr:2575_t:CDS:2 [Funneliformis caledonium]